MLVNKGRSVEDKEYIDGTCKLKAMIMCAILDTGLDFSLYTVKFSSLHRMSALEGFASAQKEG